MIRSGQFEDMQMRLPGGLRNNANVKYPPRTLSVYLDGGEHILLPLD